MDNFEINVISEGDKQLLQALELAFGKHTAVGWSAKNGQLVFYRYESSEMIPLPYGMEADQAFQFAKGWLEKSAKWGKEPDHDGDNGKGWRVFNQQSGFTHSVLVAVAPEWAQYGK